MHTKRGVERSEQVHSGASAALSIDHANGKVSSSQLTMRTEKLETTEARSSNKVLTRDVVFCQPAITVRAMAGY